MKTATTERPILFSAPMVRALLSGRKTQTRRIAKLNETLFRDEYPDLKETAIEAALKVSPYQVGMRLWVRETWGFEPPRDIAPLRLSYRADKSVIKIDPDSVQWERLAAKDHKGGWRPSIHMPRWASRITLEIEKVRVERIQDISETDATAEGFEARVAEMWWQGYRKAPDGVDGGMIHQTWPGESPPDWMIDPKPVGRATEMACDARRLFRNTWDNLNGCGAWERNDFVWALTLRRLP